MNTKTLVVIDTALNDYQRLLPDSSEDCEVFLIDSTQDGFKQLAGYLNGKSGYGAIHLYSHGSSGRLSLGSASLGLGNLDEYQGQLKQIGAALSGTGDLLVYGCNVAQGEMGRRFIDRLAEVTGADVGASEDLTGATGLGGDWVLEASADTIETATQIEPEPLKYPHTLSSDYFPLSSDLLRDAINLSIAAYDSNNYRFNSNAPSWELVSREAMGITNADLFTGDYLFNPDIAFSTSDPEAIVAVDDINDILAISFRGTESKGDFLTDINGNHNGNFSDYYQNFIPLLNGVDYFLNQHTSIRKVLVTGHSLGGAVAELFMDQHDDEGTVRLYRGITFGSPGNDYASINPDDRLFNFRHSEDPIVDGVSI